VKGFRMTSYPSMKMIEEFQEGRHGRAGKREPERARA
jgi:hypothetical protein